MISRRFLLLAMTLWLIAGCANSLYQGELAAADAYGKDRHFPCSTGPRATHCSGRQKPAQRFS